MLLYIRMAKRYIIAFLLGAFYLFIVGSVGTRSGSKWHDSKGQNSEPRIAGVRAPPGCRLAKEREPWGLATSGDRLTGYFFWWREGNFLVCYVREKEFFHL